jgi:site-specific DNA-methyltransferase (adenine-specific)
MSIQITNEDNMQLMARYPDKYFELAIVDPEYGIGASKPSKKNAYAKQKNGSKLAVKQFQSKNKDWDLKTADQSYLDELYRVSKHQVIFGANYYGLKGGMIVWDKLNGECDQMGCEIAYCSMNQRTDIVYFLWSGFMQGVYCGKDVRRAVVQQGNKKLNETRIHETQKPVPLYKYLLDNYANPSDKILDTHLGSGSIAIACHDYGFDLTACELDTDYFNAAMKRITQHQSQLSVFE